MPRWRESRSQNRDRNRLSGHDLAGAIDRRLRLTQRRGQRTLRNPTNDGVDGPVHGGWNLTAQHHCLDLEVDSAIRLLVPGDAVQPPYKSTALARRQFVLIGLAVALDFLHADGVRNAVGSSRS